MGMHAIDAINSAGTRRLLRPLSRIALRTMPAIGLARLTRIAGRRVVAASAFNPAALQTCGNIEKALKDPRLLYEAMRYTIANMKLDICCFPGDLTLEAETLGCGVRFAALDAPAVDYHPITELQDSLSLVTPDPARHGRMPLVLEALRAIKKNHAFLTAVPVAGPFTLAMQLRGPQVFVDTLRHPEGLRVLLDRCEKTILTYARALSAAGADIIIVAEPAMSQMSQAAYDQFSRPYTIRIADSIGRPCVLHICGGADHLIERMSHSAVAGISVDDVDISSVARRVPKDTVVVGNISPLFLLYKTPEEVRHKTAELLRCISIKREFLVAPGCDVAPRTPLANILAFVETVKRGNT